MSNYYKNFDFANHTEKTDPSNIFGPPDESQVEPLLSVNKEEKIIHAQAKEATKELQENKHQLNLVDSQYFDQIVIDSPCCILLVGAPKKGKSNTIKALILQHTLYKKYFNFGMVFTGTKFNKDYDYLPEKYIFEGYDPKVLKTYLEGIRKQLDDGRKIPASFIILDDLLGILNSGDPTMLHLLSCRRHYNITVFLATQYILQGASTTLRNVLTHAVCYNCKAHNTIKALYENVGFLFENLSAFKEYFLYFTKRKYTGILYLADEDELDCNYLQFRSPDVSNLQVVLDY